MKARLTGVVTPLLTPYEDDLSIAEGLYLDHAAFCLESGAHYLSPFGTTGEASSNTMSERMGVLEQLVASGTVPPEQLMPGTGLCNLGDTVTLTPGSFNHTSTEKGEPWSHGSPLGSDRLALACQLGD